MAHGFRIFRCQVLEKRFHYNFILKMSDETEKLTDEQSKSKDQTTELPKPASLTNSSGLMAKAWVRPSITRNIKRYFLQKIKIVLYMSCTNYNFSLNNTSTIQISPNGRKVVEGSPFH